MNDEQLEIACREYCRLEGEDPDQVIEEERNEIYTIPKHIKWECYKGFILDHYHASLAIKKAFDSGYTFGQTMSVEIPENVKVISEKIWF